MHDPVSELAREWLVRAEADELTPYAVEFRYPDALPVMPLELARAAAGTARRIYTFVMARLE
ncbi:MAG: hypothetical protein ACE5H9_19760 [Anaerolineae bacterium]